MTEPTITCPNCKTEIRLTESLAAPLIAATRKQFEEQLSQKDAEVAKREEGIREKEKQVLEAKRNLDEQVADQVAAQLKAERAHVIAEESKKIDKQLLETESQIMWQNIADMRNVLAHDYRGIDPEIVFDVVINELPKLKIAFIQMLHHLPAQAINKIIETNQYSHLKGIL